MKAKYRKLKTAYGMKARNGNGESENVNINVMSAYLAKY